MKKTLFNIFFCLAATTACIAQHTDGCGTDAIHQHKMATDPAYAAKTNSFDASFRNINTPKTLTNNIIPVVVHVMHKGEPVGEGTNITDQAVRAQIQNINQHFRKIAGTQGDGNGVDAGIEFALAARNPQGGCTNGIDRVNMSNVAQYMANGVKRSSANGISDEQLKAYSTWNTSQYYNIWLISELDNGQTTTDGYAYFASAHGESYDGMVVLAASFGDTGSSTATHELGHALNLYHTFEGDGSGNACPPANGCGTGAGDCCADTPPHIRGISNCDSSNTNSCDSNNDLSFLYNYMSYSNISCRDMFTADQRTRMQAALTSLRGSYLAANGNMSLVPPGAPDVAFRLGSGEVLCSVGQAVKLYDNSSCIPNTFMDETSWPGISFNWTVSNGTNTYTSTAQNPEIMVNAAGTYSVTLSITGPGGTASHTEPNIITVNTGATPEPWCEPQSGLNGSYAYAVGNVLFNTINKSTSLLIGGPYENFICSDNTILMAGQTYPISVTVRANNSNAFEFKVFIDYNNDTFFENTEVVFEGVNPAGSVNTFTGNITIPQSAVQNELLIMRVIGDAGTLSNAEINCNSNLFIGDVEDYGIMINGTASAGNFIKDNLRIYPNPANSAFTITADVMPESVTLYNMLGQPVLTQKITGTEATVDISSLSAGTYLIEATAGERAIHSKIIKQ